MLGPKFGVCVTYIHIYYIHPELKIKNIKDNRDIQSTVGTDTLASKLAYADVRSPVSTIPLNFKCLFGLGDVRLS